MATTRPEDAARQARGFRDLIAWQKADRLASETYRLCKHLRGEHWLVDQAVRAAVSVPANIAEGHGRGSLAEFLRFLDIAKGSLSELEYFLHFIEAESLVPKEKLGAVVELHSETARVLWGLWRSLKASVKADWNHTGNRIREDQPTWNVDNIFGPD